MRTRGPQASSGTVLYLSWSKKTRGAVHLRTITLRAVDDERAVLGHERHVAHVDVLLLDVAVDLERFLVNVPDDQA